MARYRKRPVVIEAVQITPDPSFAELDAFLPKNAWFIGREHITIRTLEGDMRAEIGDWIIRGVKGEFYPCKPDIFAATYEEVEP